MNDLAPFDSYAAQLSEGGEMRLPPVQIAHYPVTDTALAAALFVLGVPPRDPVPFTRDTVLDAKGNETGRLRMTWWTAGESASGTLKTEAVFGWWEERARFEREFPLHPLVSMRAAQDQRTFWLRVMNTRGMLPVELKEEGYYATDSLHGASVLAACGYKPLAYSGRAFFLRGSNSGVHAEQLLETAALSSGQTPPQWMAVFLAQYSHLLGIAKGQSIIVQQQFGDRTLMLTDDSTPKTRDKFFRALNLLP